MLNLTLPQEYLLFTSNFFDTLSEISDGFDYICMGDFDELVLFSQNLSVYNKFYKKHFKFSFSEKYFLSYDENKKSFFDLEKTFLRFQKFLSIIGVSSTFVYVDDTFSRLAIDRDFEDVYFEYLQNLESCSINILFDKKSVEEIEEIRSFKSKI